jgi:hypothetical protein
MRLPEPPPGDTTAQPTTAAKAQAASCAWGDASRVHQDGVALALSRPSKMGDTETDLLRQKISLFSWLVVQHAELAGHSRSPP